MGGFFSAMHVPFTLLLLLVVFEFVVGGGGSCDETPKECRTNSSWNLDDGPCWDLRGHDNMSYAYEQATAYFEQFYPFTEWKRLDWGKIRESGIANAKLADEKNQIVEQFRTIARAPVGA